MKLLCKKTLRKSIKITPGKYYHFKDMEIENNIVYWYSSTVCDDGQTFYFSNKPAGDFYIWKYFYTSQQLRKMKLQKLYETTL